jgi:hypothetical protein
MMLDFFTGSEDYLLSNLLYIKGVLWTAGFEFT